MACNPYENSIMRFTAAEYTKCADASSVALEVRKRTARKHNGRRTGTCELHGTERRLSTTIDALFVPVGSTGIQHTAVVSGRDVASSPAAKERQQNNYVQLYKCTISGERAANGQRRR